MPRPRTRAPLRAFVAVLAVAASTFAVALAPPASAASVIDGPDVSSYQHPSGAVIRWAKVKAAGKEFGDLTEGEVVVLKPLGAGKYKVVIRIASPETWSKWAK